MRVKSSRHSSTEEHQACTLGVVGSSPAGGSKEHGSTSGAVMSDTVPGLGWEMGQVAAELFAIWNDENPSWNGYVSNDTVDIPHPYEDERL